MRGTQADETLHTKEAYERLLDTHGDRVCAYRVNNRMFSYPLLNDSVQTWGQHISYWSKRNF